MLQHAVMLLRVEKPGAHPAAVSAIKPAPSARTFERCFVLTMLKNGRNKDEMNLVKAAQKGREHGWARSRAARRSATRSSFWLQGEQTRKQNPRQPFCL